jgi:hypothetical protein
VHPDFCEVAVAYRDGVRVLGTGRDAIADAGVVRAELAAERRRGASRRPVPTGSSRSCSAMRSGSWSTTRASSVDHRSQGQDRPAEPRTLVRLFASGLLEEIWTPDGRPRTLRRLTNRRERLVPSTPARRMRRTGSWPATSASLPVTAPREGMTELTGSAGAACR